MKNKISSDQKYFLIMIGMVMIYEIVIIYFNNKAMVKDAFYK